MRTAHVVSAASIGMLLLAACWGPSKPALVVAQTEPASVAAAGGAAPKPCRTYADCPEGMICQGAGPETGGTCMPPGSGPQPKMAIDRLPKGYLGATFGQPIIKGKPPQGVPEDQAGGTWDLNTTTYYPPQGGGWRYQRGPDQGFGGHWVYDSMLQNPAPGQEVIPAKQD